MIFLIAQVAGVQSDTVIIALAVLTTITTIVTAVLAAAVAIATRQTAATLGQTAAKVDSTHALVNGLTAELRSAETGQARAEGITEGEAQQRARTDAER